MFITFSLYLNLRDTDLNDEVIIGPFSIGFASYSPGAGPGLGIITSLLTFDLKKECLD